MTSKKKISILLAEDHAIVRQGLRTLLETEGSFAIVGQAQTGREAVAMAKSLRPGCHPDGHRDAASSTAWRPRGRYMAAHPSAKVLILSAHSDDEYIEPHDCRRGLGLPREADLRRDPHQGDHARWRAARSISAPRIAKRMAREPASARGAATATPRPPPSLRSASPRCSSWSRRVGTNKQVADSELGISIKTVEKHRQHLMDKLNIHDTAGLTRYAISHRIIESDVQVTVF
jgi:DNA-binding NarL/FixJ family response regulator